MRIAYLDCFAGISGDMFLGALLDAGVPAEHLHASVADLALGASLHIEKVDRSGITSTKVHVLENGHLAEDAPHTLEHTEPHTHTHPGGTAHAHTHPEAHNHAPATAAPLTHTHTHTHPDGTEHTHTHTHPEAAHTHPDGTEHSHSHTDGTQHTHSHPDGSQHSHSHGRSLTVIRDLIRTSSLAQPVKDLAILTFELLGTSEAKIHNVPVDKIHFHEVGAVDAIVDIVAASAGIHYLNQQSLDETGQPLQWHASPLNVGGGMVQCAHGNFPVPAPATADLLRGLPTYSAHLQKELVTPTGAALVRALSPHFGQQPAMRVAHIGYGAGTRNPPGFPNVLRLSVGDTDAAHDSTQSTSTGAQAHADLRASHASGSGHPLPASFGEGSHSHSAAHTGTVTVLETALDDLSPQILAHVTEQALTLGALDVMTTAVGMKKGRPGTLITILTDEEHSPALERLLLRETSTLGIRVHHQHRICLARQHQTVETPFGDIRIKIGSFDSEDLNAAPEFEDCRSAALAHHVPVKQVIQAAVAAYVNQVH